MTQPVTDTPLRDQSGSDDYIDPVIEAYKKDVDRTIIRHNLRLSVQQRFENLMELQRFAEEMRAAMLRATGGR
jgi:hypothetical protein